jgi:hypothetical protein
LEDGPPGFPRGFTCPAVLESPSQEAGIRFAYGPITLYGPAFQPFRLRIRLVTSRRFRNTARTSLATPGLQRLRAWHRPGLGCSRFARHYSGNRGLLSLPEGTEMFHFPSFASGTYGFSAGSRGFAAGGFPIRKSPGQSLLGGSPELIAACHVLHRLLTPGHPPCALIRLITTQRMKKFRTHSRNRLSKNPGRAVLRAPIRKNRTMIRTMYSASLAPVGGGERDRTDDLLVANQALSQLSYTPGKSRYRSGRGTFLPRRAVHGPPQDQRGGPR